MLKSSSATNNDDFFTSNYLGFFGEFSGNFMKFFWNSSGISNCTLTKIVNATKCAPSFKMKSKIQGLQNAKKIFLVRENLEILWEFFGNSLGIVWNFFRNSLGILWCKFWLKERRTGQGQNIKSLEALIKKVNCINLFPIFFHRKHLSWILFQC